MSAMDEVLRDPRYEYRQVVFILSEGDAEAFIAAREREGWDLFLRQTLFDRDDKPHALGLGFRKTRGEKMTTDEQLRARAEAIIADVVKAELGLVAGENPKRRVLVGRVRDQLVMAYNMGVVNAEARIYGALWEYLFQSISPSANENEREANSNAALGWEYLTSDGRWLIWRRRKVAAEVEICGRCEHEIDLHGLFSGCKVLGCQCSQFHRGEGKISPVENLGGES